MYYVMLIRSLHLILESIWQVLININVNYGTKHQADDLDAACVLLIVVPLQG